VQPVNTLHSRRSSIAHLHRARVVARRRGSAGTERSAGPASPRCRRRDLAGPSPDLHESSGSRIWCWS